MTELQAQSLLDAVGVLVGLGRVCVLLFALTLGGVLGGVYWLGRK